MMLNGTRTGGRFKAAVSDFLARAKYRLAARRLSGPGLGAAGDGATPGGDPWAVTVNDRPITPAGQFLAGVVGFGIVSFAASTAGIRGWRWVKTRV